MDLGKGKRLIVVVAVEIVVLEVTNEPVATFDRVCSGCLLLVSPFAPCLALLDSCFLLATGFSSWLRLFRLVLVFVLRGVLRGNWGSHKLLIVIISLRVGAIHRIVLSGFLHFPAICRSKLPRLFLVRLGALFLALNWETSILVIFVVKVA